VSHLDALGRDVLLEALHAIADVKKQSELTIAIVGVTNVRTTSRSIWISDVSFIRLANRPLSTL